MATNILFMVNKKMHIYSGTAPSLLGKLFAPSPFACPPRTRPSPPPHPAARSVASIIEVIVYRAGTDYTVQVYTHQLLL